MDTLTWLVNLPPDKIVLLGLLGIVSFFVRSMVFAQRDTTKTLHNHLAHIDEHMAKTNKALDLILDRLLDSALRTPEERTVSAVQPREIADRPWAV